jgi:PIF1-like helicase
LHGPAGSGKSTVLEIIRTYAKAFCDFISPHLYDKKVIVITAMTGVAATMIQGETTHSALYLNQKKRFEADQIETWEATKLVIIDEISFASSTDIEKIHANLTQLKQTTYKKFGGLNIVFCGDMRQLEPVDKKPIYDDNVHQFKSWINCYINLNGLHRFKEDPKWGKLLKRFRDGTVTEKDIKKINTRVVTNELSLPKNIKYATYDNASRDAINTALFCKRCKNNTKNPALYRTTMIIFANEFKIKNRNKTMTKFKNPKLIWELCGEDDIKVAQRQGRMDPVLKLYIGCPMMIPYNINVSAGIANGTQCILKQIVLKPDTFIQNVTIENEITVQAVFASDVTSIILEHSNPQENMPKQFQIVPKKYTFKLHAKPKTQLYNKTVDENENPAQMTALQLPILVNNATTGHKLQGSSVHSLFVNQWNYSKNWPYVLLSRVKTIDGLHLRTPLSTDLEHYHVPEKLTEMIQHIEKFLPVPLSKTVYNQLKL